MWYAWLRIRWKKFANTEAWVMGQDTSVAGFHETLLKMLNDFVAHGARATRRCRWCDSGCYGRPQIHALLEPAKITALQPGRVIDPVKWALQFTTADCCPSWKMKVTRLRFARRFPGGDRSLWSKAGQMVNAGDQNGQLWIQALIKVWELYVRCI